MVINKKKRRTERPPYLSLKHQLPSVPLVMFANSSAQERVKSVLEELSKYLSQGLKIFEVMLQNLIDDFPINVQVIMNQHIAKANNSDPLLL